MSEKQNLLKEGTVRRFMKLAGTQAIASDFLKETYQEELNEAPEDDPLDVDPAAAPDPDLDDEIPAGEVPEEPVGADLEADEEEAEEDAAALEGSVEEFARDMLDAIKDIAKEHGVEMEVEELPEPDEIEVGEMEEVPEDEADLAGPPEDLTPAPEGADEEMPEELAELNYIDESALMETVYKRVTERLLKEKRTDDVATLMAEKISNKLNKKIK